MPKSSTSCMQRLGSNSARVLIPAGIGYAAGYGMELAVTAACPSSTLLYNILGAVARTHTPAIYQIDCHQFMLECIAKYCCSKGDENRPLLPKNSSVQTQQPKATTMDPDLSVAKATKESNDGCCPKILEGLATRGFPSVATGFALGAFPLALGFTGEVAEYAAKGIQACAPSFFGCMTSTRDNAPIRESIRNKYCL